MRKRRDTFLFGLPVFVLLALAILQITLIFGQRGRGKEISPDVQSRGGSQASLLTPGAMYITLGSEDGAFIRIETEDEAFGSLFSDCLQLAKRMSMSNWFVEDSSGHLPRQEAAIVFSYPVLMNMDLIREEMELSFGEELSYAFDQLWILPSLEAMETPRIFLVNTGAENIMRLEAGSREWEENLSVYSEMLLLGTTRDRTYLESSFVFDKPADNGGFILQPSQKEIILTGKIGSYFNSPVMSKEEIKKRISAYGLSFFEYPDTVTVDQDDDRTIYMNEKISLRINRNGLVEYVETLTNLEKEKVSLKEAYRIAFDFLLLDLSRQSGIHPVPVFAGYEEKQDEYVFYFDYMLDHHMLVPRLTGSSLEHACRIVVRGTKVQRSERLALELHLNRDRKALTYSWLDMANREEAATKKLPLLVYYDVNGTIVPRWVMETNDGKVERVAY